MVNFIKKTISKYDIFPAAPILRANGQSEVTNIYTGILSICLLTLFIYIFISNIVSTINLQSIVSTQTIEMNSDQNKTISNIKMAIGLQELGIDNKNLVKLRDIFQLQVYLLDRQLNAQIVETFPCQRTMWNMFNDTKYKTLRLDTHLCIKSEAVAIFGENGSPLINFLHISLSSCNNATSPVVCKSSTDINTYLTTQMSAGRFFILSFVILNTGINPTNQNPYAYNSYEKTLWVPFTKQQQILGQIFLGTFQINTDTNFLPTQTIVTQTGYFVNQASISTVLNINNSPILAQIYVFASPVNIVYDRTYGKFDEILSYIGGLFGLVASFFAFFFMSFNQYKYELRVSEGAFSFKDSHLARQENLSLFKYIKYVVYDWIKTLFCYQIEWKDCKAIQQARGQAIQQIDVKNLLKRITHIQKILSIVVNIQNQSVIHLAQSTTLGQLKQRRRINDYTDKFVDNIKSITISTYDQALQSLALQANKNNNAVHPLQNFNNSLIQLQRSDNFSKDQANKQKQSSIQLMKKYLKMYIERFKIVQANFDLDEQDLKIERQLTQSFYNLDQQIRIKIIKKIPLGILYRIQSCKQKKQTNFQTIHTQQYLQRKDQKKEILHLGNESSLNTMQLKQ